MSGEVVARKRSKVSDEVSLRSNQSDDSSKVGMKRTVGLAGGISLIVGVMIGRFFNLYFVSHYRGINSRNGVLRLILLFSVMH